MSVDGKCRTTYAYSMGIKRIGYIFTLKPSKPKNVYEEVLVFIFFTLLDQIMNSLFDSFYREGD